MLLKAWNHRELTCHQIWSSFVHEFYRTIAVSAGINLELTGGYGLEVMKWPMKHLIILGETGLIRAADHILVHNALRNTKLLRSYHCADRCCLMGVWKQNCFPPIYIHILNPVHPILAQKRNVQTMLQIIGSSPKWGYVCIVMGPTALCFWQFVLQTLASAGGGYLAHYNMQYGGTMAKVERWSFSKISGTHDMSFSIRRWAKWFNHKPANMLVWNEMLRQSGQKCTFAANNNWNSFLRVAHNDEPAPDVPPRKLL